MERLPYTGAYRSYEGKLPLADGGTLLLDEIGELSPLAQAKLLRVLESREVFRLGARSATPIDVRVIAATNRDLESLVGSDGFRSDLFFRLNVARMHLPPLRARPEDIATLIEHYADEMSERTGVRLGALSQDTIDCLTRYTWPGNVRELRNVVEALFVDPPEGEVAVQHLPPNLARRLTQCPSTDVAERERIVAALFATRWNKRRAAENLRWSRMTLYRKMAKHGIGEADRT